MSIKNLFTAKQVFNIIGYSLVLIVAILCLLPFIIMVSGSFTSDKVISDYGFGIFPKEISYTAYQMIFRYPNEILRAYGVTIFITIIGTTGGLFAITMIAYVLGRKDFKYRNYISFYFYFTTLFSGGLVATYIFIIRYLNLKDNYLALILPIMINVFYLFIMKGFMRTIPESISESAKIEGAGDFTIFIKLVLPLSKSGLAIIGMFIALDYWNDWYNAMLYLTDKNMFPLQYLLYTTLNSTGTSSAANDRMGSISSQSLKLAVSVVTIGPIVLLYPFIQKYFIKGITLGAVKE